MEPGPQSALITEYAEASASFRLLTEIRFKLLGFLPLTAGVATGVITSRRANAGTLALSLFGLAVTLALLIYNERNNQLYNELVGRAAAIERQLGLPDGAFANRPAPWLTIGPLRIDHGTGVGTIYAATVGLWLYGSVSSALLLIWEANGAEREHQAIPSWVGAAALALAIVVPVTAWRLLRGHARGRQSAMRFHAKSAVEAALRVEPFDVRQAAVHQNVIEHCALLAGKAPAGIAERARHYAGLGAAELLLYLPGSPEPTDPRERQRAAASLVALLTDLPPRWVDDVATGRR